MKKCNPDAENAPETIGDLLKAWVDEDGQSGIDIFKKLIEARIKLTKNYLKFIRGILAASCDSPCSSGDNVEGDSTILVNEESDN